MMLRWKKRYEVRDVVFTLYTPGIAPIDSIFYGEIWLDASKDEGRRY